MRNVETMKPRVLKAINDIKKCTNHKEINN